MAKIMTPKEVFGEEVEFWVGEGEDAEKYIVHKKTVVTIPANIYHLPILVRKDDKPFLTP